MLSQSCLVFFYDIRQESISAFVVCWMALNRSSDCFSKFYKICAQLGMQQDVTVVHWGLLYKEKAV